MRKRKIKKLSHVCPLIFLYIVFLQGVESVFDIMDLEDEERNKLLRLDDNQIQVRTRSHYKDYEFDISDLWIQDDFLNTELCAREPASFWRENIIVVVTFLGKKVH